MTRYSEFKFLLCIVILFDRSWAKLSYDEVKVTIFDKSVRSFESSIYNSLQTTENFYNQKEVTAAIDTGLFVVSFVPYIGQLAAIVPIIRGAIADESDWHAVFTAAIAHETRREIAIGDVRWMQSIMKTIEEKIKLLGEANPDFQSRKIIASQIHSNIDHMLNFFGQPDSLFKKYLLIGAPPLIELALLVAVFGPMAKSLIPLEAKNPQLSCKMLDMLLDYRPRTVVARLEKLGGRLPVGDINYDVYSQPYNPYGYNKTMPATLDCDKDCSNRDHYFYCLKDDFATDDFSTLDHDTCTYDYAALARHRVEEIFPVGLLNRLCIDARQRKVTGFGWLTVKLMKLYAASDDDGNKCDNSYLGGDECDPYVELFLDDEKNLKSGPWKDSYIFNVDITFTSKKISKNTTVRLEVWDDDSGFWNMRDDFIIGKRGTIDSFLNTGRILGSTRLGSPQSYIDIFTSWQDEYKDVV